MNGLLGRLAIAFAAEVLSTGSGNANHRHARVYPCRVDNATCIRVDRAQSGTLRWKGSGPAGLTGPSARFRAASGYARERENAWGRRAAKDRVWSERPARWPVASR